MGGVVPAGRGGGAGGGGRLAEAAGRRVVAAHAEVYRAEDPETIGVDAAAEAIGGLRPVSGPGARLEVVTDNGPEFVSRDFVAAIKAESLRRIHTRVRHPQSSGLAERFSRTFREEGWAGHHPDGCTETHRLIGQWVDMYCHTRLHSALSSLTRVESCQGGPGPPVAGTSAEAPCRPGSAPARLRGVSDL